jgi:hypothetical protein
MANNQDYSTFVSGEEEASRLLQKILSPAEAQSLVPPPPSHAPVSGPGESTPLTGSLTKAPSQASPSRVAVNDEGKAEHSTPLRSGLAGYFGNAEPIATPNRSGDPQYVKVSSQGQVGYLPKANLRLAQQIDRNLEVLDEG